MDYYLIIYFLAGILQDVFFTLNVRFVALHRVWLAVLTSFLTVIITMLALYNIVAGLDAARSLPAIVAYSFGVASGTFLAMKLKLE